MPNATLDIIFLSMLSNLDQYKGSSSQDLLLRRIWQPLDDILPPRDTHNRHTRNLPDPPLQIAIVRRNNVDLILHDAIDDAVIGIDALVVALQALPALVAGDAQRDAVLRAQLLELGHDARRDDRDALRVEGVHHGLEEGQLALDGVGEEVGVDEDGVGRHESRVVLEEEGGGDLGTGRGRGRSAFCLFEAGTTAMRAEAAGWWDCAREDGRQLTFRGRARCRLPSLSSSGLRRRRLGSSLGGHRAGRLFS